MKQSKTSQARGAPNPSSESSRRSSRAAAAAAPAGHLAQLSAMVNGSPRAQALTQRKDDIQQSSHMQNLMGLAAEMKPATPAQLVPATTVPSAGPPPMNHQDEEVQPGPGSELLVPAASSRIAAIQLKLPSVEEFLHETTQEESQKQEIQRIEFFLAKYLDEKYGDTPNIQRLFAYIDFLDKNINLWFDTHKATDMEKVPNGPWMFHLHQEVSLEHQGLVEVAFKNPDKVIPVNLNTLEKDEIVAVRKIWKSIVSESGNILVVGKTEFQKRTYANLARLLQGSYGRAMIEYLDGGTVKQSNRITISDNFDDTFKRHGDKQQPAGSYAYPRVNLRDDNDNSRDVIVEKTDKGYPVANTRDDINRLLLEGKKGANYKGVSYTFGGGSGSLVKIVEEDKPLSDKDLNQILTPSYITLGHELGHAMRNRGGASFANVGVSTSNKLITEEEGSDDDDARALWTDEEEVLNITTSEKRLREEHLLTTRHYHAPQSLATQAIFQRALAKLLRKLPNKNHEKYVFGSDAWQTQIRPALSDNKWTPQKLQLRLQLLPGIESTVFPQAKKKYAIEKQLEGLRQEHSNVISSKDFMKIKEVSEVLANLKTEDWDENGCKLKVAQITQMMNDKEWWRTVKIGGGALAALAAIGIGIYWKFLKGSK
jgi:hypothetical protein